jgi:transposase
MNATTVAVDLAKSVFQLAVADDAWRVIETHRLTRSQFERWFQNRDVGLVIMEACGSAHHWARWLDALGIAVKLLPASYVRAYVRRNKTDRADACALLEAARSSEMVPVKVKSVAQQALQGLHRIRSLWPVLPASMPCAASAGSSGRAFPKDRVPVSKRSPGCWPIRIRPSRN